MLNIYKIKIDHEKEWKLWCVCVCLKGKRSLAVFHIIKIIDCFYILQNTMMQENTLILWNNMRQTRQIILKIRIFFVKISTPHVFKKFIDFTSPKISQRRVKSLMDPNLFKLFILLTTKLYTWYFCSKSFLIIFPDIQDWSENIKRVNDIMQEYSSILSFRFSTNKTTIRKWKCHLKGLFWNDFLKKCW